jgi:hypothetical protein
VGRVVGRSLVLKLSVVSFGFLPFVFEEESMLPRTLLLALTFVPALLFAQQTAQPGLQSSNAITVQSHSFNGNFIVEINADVRANEIRGAVLNQGVMLIEQPNLASNQLLIRFANVEQMATAMEALSADDRIACFRHVQD